MARPRESSLRRCEICGVRRKKKLLDGIFLASFPLDPNICKEWVKVVGKEDLIYVPIEKLHELKHVCGDHFESSDFNKQKNRIKKFAVPSINLKADPLPDEMLQEFPYHVSSKSSAIDPKGIGHRNSKSSAIKAKAIVPINSNTDDDDSAVDNDVPQEINEDPDLVLDEIHAGPCLPAPNIPEKVRACRACLATNVRLFDLSDTIKSTYEELTGSQIPEPEDDVLPQYLCTFCIVQLRKFKNFKEKCLRATDLLNNINNIKMLNTKFIKSVDRPYYNLHNHLSISDPVFMETDFIKEEVDLVEDEEILYMKQEGQDMENTVLDEAPANDDEMDTVEYVMENEEYPESDVEFKQPKRVLNKEALEQEYNMDIMTLTEEEQFSEIEARKQTQNYLKSNHRCEDCGKGFNSNDTLNNHFNSVHHPDLGDLLCLLCKARFDSKHKLNTHVNNHKYRYNCRECDFTTMRKWSANKHRNWHQGISFTCEICDKDFNMNTSYLSHMRIHHPPEDIWCRYCGEAFISELGLRAHKRLKHANISITEFICQTCGITFLNEPALTIHNANECSPNSCAQCGDSFDTEKVLQTHILEVHTGKVKVKRRVAKKGRRKDMKKCDLCDNIFNNDVALVRHNELMGGACGGMRACVECGESFLTGDMLKDHVIESHSEIEMLCPRCNRTFVNSDDFNEHYKRVHMKKGPPRLLGTKTWGVTVMKDGPVIAEKPHPQQKPQDFIKTKPKGNPSFCEVCGKQCASSVHLTYHQRAHTGEKPYKCAICQKAFAVPKFLKEHFKVHTGERPFDCEFCSKAFKSKSALNRHRLCHTGERRHICQICSKDFLTSSDVKTHIKTVHMKITGPPRIRKPKVDKVPKEEYKEDYCIISELSN